MSTHRRRRGLLRGLPFQSKGRLEHGECVRHPGETLCNLTSMSAAHLRMLMHSGLSLIWCVIKIKKKRNETHGGQSSSCGFITPGSCLWLAVTFVVGERLGQQAVSQCWARVSCPPSTWYCVSWQESFSPYVQANIFTKSTGLANSAHSFCFLGY